MDMVLLALQRQLHSIEIMIYIGRVYKYEFIRWPVLWYASLIHSAEPHQAHTHTHLEKSNFHTICISNYASGGSITLVMMERPTRLPCRCIKCVQKLLHLTQSSCFHLIAFHINSINHLIENAGIRTPTLNRCADETNEWKSETRSDNEKENLAVAAGVEAVIAVVS